MKRHGPMIGIALLALLLGGCATYKEYKQADEYKWQVRSLAVLPLVVGDKNGRVQMFGTTELDAFLQYFRERFYVDFEREISLINGVELKLPGRDFDLNVYNGMDYASVAQTLGVDSVLAINLVLYNEVSPGARAAQVVGAVVTTLFFGGYIVEKRVVGYETHYAYLGLGRIDSSIGFPYAGPPLPSNEQQRKFFVDSLLAYIDRNLPLSTDYRKPYREKPSK